MDGSLNRFRASPVAGGWITLLRWFLAVVFLAPGLEKLAGRNIHHEGPEAVMPFFDALHAVPLYWTFLGVAQVAAGALLLFPRTATLGALLGLPVIANIAVLIVALPFTVSDRIAVGILCCGYATLLAWDWPRLQPVLAEPSASGSVPGALRHAWARPKFRASMAVAVGLWLVVHVLDRLGLI
ncbi:MAG TPA: DoxX family membrane protein [Longimicrobium sp.]|jgi:uncharacterized membrane protein YphA (DoxX/SURF4 family)|uniref:DoxX family membrane protein n=1 Tax=Longimicrobium sp. TaxID=2029185 RepID=UPI002EDAD0DC